jgi:hypothetical protein
MNEVIEIPPVKSDDSMKEFVELHKWINEQIMNGNIAREYAEYKDRLKNE